MMKTKEAVIKQSTQKKEGGEKKSIRWKDPSPGKKKKHQQRPTMTKSGTETPPLPPPCKEHIK